MKQLDLPIVLMSNYALAGRWWLLAPPASQSSLMVLMMLSSFIAAQILNIPKMFMRLAVAIIPAGK